MDYGIHVQWTAFPLHPETPEDGLTLEELFAGRAIDLDQARQRLKRVAGDLGLPLGERKRTYNSRRAQELAKWAESKGKGEEFHKAVFRAYFVEGRNIAKVDELASLVTSIGLPGEEVKQVLDSGAFKQAVDSDWSRCHALGITAVPTFAVDHQLVVGFQPYEALVQLIKTKNARI